MTDPATRDPTDFLAAIASVASREARAASEREGRQDRVRPVDACVAAMTWANQAARANPRDFGPLAIAAAERVYDLLDYLTAQCSREDLPSWSDAARKQVQHGLVRQRTPAVNRGVPPCGFGPPPV